MKGIKSLASNEQSRSKKRSIKKSIKFSINESEMNSKIEPAKNSSDEKKIKLSNDESESKVFAKNKLNQSNEPKSSKEFSFESAISFLANNKASSAIPSNSTSNHDQISKQTSSLQPSTNDDLDKIVLSDKHDTLTKLKNEKSIELKSISDQSKRSKRRNDSDSDEMAPVKFRSNLNDSIINDVSKLSKRDSVFKSENVSKSRTRKQSILKMAKKQSKSTRDCRICLQTVEDDADVLRPCACTGSQAYVHKGCLEEWIRVRGLIKCDICKQEYIGLDLIKKHKGILNWIFGNPLVCAYLFAGLMVSLFFFYLFFVAYLEYRTSKNLVSNYLRVPFLSVSIFYIMLFILALIGFITKGVIIYLNWRRENYTVTIGRQMINLPSNASDAINQQPINYLDPIAIDQHPKGQLPKSINLSNALQPFMV